MCCFDCPRGNAKVNAYVVPLLGHVKKCFSLKLFDSLLGRYCIIFTKSRIFGIPSYVWFFIYGMGWDGLFLTI
jgi:hypothetical protein